ncbi:hypothetical protein KUTeg_016175 [Tegillarca granosa]|uniref:Integrase core domain-containing protein n=1 Tax=Tegillarca granosa TaxID=220873 RepID=A0ABQ9EKC3_TEGGR|nr:hypothetical protein KUTeg_016175 [Tegillarca granosa]
MLTVCLLEDDMSFDAVNISVKAQISLFTLTVGTNSNHMEYLCMQLLMDSLEYIAHFYLNYTREIDGVPCIIYADRGTENSIVRDLQYALRWYHGDEFEGLSSFIYGSSQRNTRKERFWRNLRSMCGQSYMDIFKGMAEYGVLETSDNIHLEFCCK